MNATEAIKKIKLALGLEKFAEQKALADGKIVEANPDFELGAQLSIVGEDGTLAPAPEGEHTLESGTKVLVDSAGVIVEITDPSTEEMEEDKKEEKMEDMTPEQEIEEAKAELAVAEIVDQIVEALKPMVQEVAAMKEEVVEMKKKFAAFSAEPAAKPVKNNFNAVATPTDKRLEILAQLRKSTKQNKK